MFKKNVFDTYYTFKYMVKVSSSYFTTKYLWVIKDFDKIKDNHILDVFLAV